MERIPQEETIDKCVNKAMALTELRLHTDNLPNPYNAVAVETYQNIGCYECLDGRECKFYDPKPSEVYKNEL